MIEVYTWGTPNGHKVNIMVEEIGLPYELNPIDISKGEQKTPAYLAVNPNGKIPAIVDREGDKVVRVFESGAILIYLAEKSGKLLSPDPAKRMDVLGWTFWQVGGLGPMMGQWNHFASRDEKLPYAIERYRDETQRLFGVMDGALGSAEYLAGEYSIADIACYSWAKYGLQKIRKEIDETKFPNVQAWLDRVGARPAVQKGLSLVGAPR
jgi:GST-like protein